MILLDTNILSELMRADVSKQVIAWLDLQAVSSLFICAITRAEIELGLCLLLEGKRKEQLKQAALEMFDEFTGRCLPFEENSAKHYAQLVAHRHRSGRPISVEDAQISAIALTHGMKLATRNTKDFTSIGELELINPWNLSNLRPSD
jgi:predicted nucleic acid-binding protein